MKTEKMLIAGDEKTMNELLKFVRKHLGAGIHYVNVKPCHDDLDQLEEEELDEREAEVMP